MKIKTLIRQATAMTVAGAALCLSPVAQSGPITLHPTGYYVAPQLQFGLTIGGSPHAGAFVGTVEPSLAPVIFWCAELTEFFNFGTPYVYQESQSNNLLLQELFTDVMPAFLAPGGATPQTSAAIQLAIWEIIYDTGNLNILTGAPGEFYATSGDLPTRQLAQDILNNLGNPPAQGLWNVFSWTRVGNQDFVTATPPGRTVLLVPEPTPLLLIGAALMAMMVFFKRRRGQKATS